MKIVCDGCHAQGEVPDDRVKGRKLTLRCRSCGKTLVVQGDAHAEQHPSPPVEPSASGEWYVRIEGQQFGPYNIVQMVGMFRAKQLTWQAQVRRARSSEWSAAAECRPLVHAAAARGPEGAPPPPTAPKPSRPPPPPPPRGKAKDQAALTEDTQPDLDVSELRELETLEDEPLPPLEDGPLRGSEPPPPREAPDESLWSHEEAPSEPAARAWPASRDELDLGAVAPPASTAAPALANPAAPVVAVPPPPVPRVDARDRTDSLVASDQPMRAARSGMARAVLIGSAMIAAAIVFAVLRLRPEAAAPASAAAARPSAIAEPAPPATTTGSEPALEPAAAPSANVALPAASAPAEAPKPELATPQPHASAATAERPKRSRASAEPTLPAPTAAAAVAEPEPEAEDDPSPEPPPASAARKQPEAPEHEGNDFLSSAAPLSDTPSHAQVTKTMREVQPQVRACAQGQGASTATVAVTVVGATGRVSRVRISGVPDEVGTCIGRAVHAAQFPRFARSEFAIDYAFRLGE